MVVSGQASVLDEKKTLSRMRRSAVHLGDDKTAQYTNIAGEKTIP
jgi:hypothetical protein